MTPESAPKAYFGLRQQLMAGTPTEATSGTSTRNTTKLFQKGASVTALALMNAALLVTGAEAQAADAPAETAKPKKIDPAAALATEMSEVVVQGAYETYRPERAASPKFTQNLRDTPQTVTVVPQKVMKDQGATNLRDVLRNVPGISIQAGEGGVPAGDNLTIRGFNARTDLFIDGVRDVGGYARDSFNFEQVEVVKGPASAYSGRGSTGGSVNIVTKAPKLDRSYRGEVGFGTDQYKRFTLDFNQPFRIGGSSAPAPTVDAKAVVDGKKTVIPVDPEYNAAFRFNGLWHENETPGRDEVNNTRWGVAPSVAFGLGTPTTLTLSYMHLAQENVPDYGIPFVPALVREQPFTALPGYNNKVAPVDYSNFYGLISRDYERTITDVGNLELKHSFNDDTNLRFLSRYGRTTRDSIIAAPRFASATSTDILREFKSRDQVDEVFSNQLDINTKFNTWGLKHALVGGLEYTHENDKNYDRLGPPAKLADLYNPNPHQGYSGAVRRTGAVNDADADTYAVYVFDTITITPKWLLSGGIRYDYFDLDFDSYNVAGVNQGFSQTNKMFSWRASLAYKPVETGTIYFSYGTSFNPTFDTISFNPSNTPLQALDPEKNESFEIGTKWDLLDERLTISAAAFHTKKKNARTDGLPGDPPLVLDGEQIVQGFELGITGNITENWAIFAGYTYLDSEIENSNDPLEVGRQLPNTPEQSFSLWTTYKLPWNLEVGGGVRFVDSRYSNPENTREVDSYWTADAMLTWHATENIDVRLNVYNITNEEYIDRVGGGHIVPGPTRSATLTASFKF